MFSLATACRSTLAVACVVGATACGGEEPRGKTVPPNSPAYTGRIEGRAPDNRVLLRTEENECGVELAQSARTEVLIDRNGTYVFGRWEDIRLGDGAAVWIEGYVAQSCPEQALAEVVAVTPG